MLHRVSIALACSALLLSACKSSSRSASTEASINFEQRPDIRRHSPKLDAIRSLAHTVRGKKLAHGLSSPHVVGGATEDPNTGPAGMTFFGNGPMLESPDVYVVFWGSAVDATVVSTIPTFFANAFGNNAFMQGVNEYDATTPYNIGNATFRGSFTDANAPMGMNSTVTDLDVQEELTRMLDQGELPPNTGHNIYMVYFPPGLTIDQGGGALSCDVFCA